jgi:hypothetical protein
MFGEHVDPEPFSRVKVSVRAGLVTDANQHQNRIERDRRKCIGRHAFHFAIVVNGDDGDAGGEASHGSAEFVLSGAHGSNEICTTNTGFPARRPFRYDSFGGEAWALFAS